MTPNTMKSGRSTRRTLGRLLRACGLALLALGLFAPSARAGHCGQYVLGDESLRRELTRLLEGVDSGRLPTLPLPVAPRCNGPSCSGQPAAPIPPLVAPVLTGEDWACPAARIAPEPEGMTLLTPDEADPRPIRRGPSIFHPPRPALPSA